MIKTLSNIFKQDKEKFVIPRSLKSGEINLHVLINLQISTTRWQAK